MTDFKSLSQKEIVILESLLESKGESRKAWNLAGIAHSTYRTHISNILNKTNLKSISGVLMEYVLYLKQEKEKLQKPDRLQILDTLKKTYLELRKFEDCNRDILIEAYNVIRKCEEIS